ncbi:piwi-like protein Siwi isoform X1 [Cotesia glomerata]|uniref:piwi-like protein Siwi isoform X1 n=1 Tax=Cotesia glomerata TaxID=32391 RepID=UPI001D029D79|nr:piwi-like protein Siwi isoform X1 [Cotesia glomerata]XP_044590640.1 piwi-like protein Siwi isoform X1 [Cotesia glomerata]
MDNRRDRPAGRSRGRASNSAPQQQPQGVWGRRPGPSQAHDSAQQYGPPPTKYFRPQSLGRSVRAPVPTAAPAGDQRPPGVDRPAPPPSSVAPVGGGGDASASAAGRGAMRGRRMVNPDILNSRPVHVKASKKGTGGNPIKLQANFFKILSAPDWCLKQYRVDFAPEEDRLMVRKGLIRIHKDALGIYIFDGTLLYSVSRYQCSKTEAWELFSQRQSDNAQIRISIRLVGEMTKGDPAYPQFYNIIARKGLEHLKLKLVNRDYYDPKASVNIHEFGLQLWPGYQTSIRQHERDVLMSCEITHKVMRQETIYHVLQKVRNQCRGGDVHGACKAAVLNSRVMTDYNNNTYRIDDIDFSRTPQSTFPLGKDQVPTTYLQYYQSKYGISIRDPKQPLLASRSDQRDRRAGQDEIIYLIPELCRTTGLTDEMRNDYKLMAALAKHTRVNPDRRIDKLLMFNRRLQETPAVVQEFKQWNLRLDTNLVEIPARVIPPENIIFGASRESATQSADWTKHFRSSRLIVCTKLSDWVLIVPNSVRRGEAQNFVSNIIKAGQGMSFFVSQPRVIDIRRDYASDYADELENILSRSTPQLVCCVSPRPRADVYASIKKKCCVDRPVPSQVILAKNLASKGAMSIATKVAIQMNCKIGGAPWTMEFGMAGLMVVGFDVCHDPNQRGTDYGAMVATLDRGMTRYFSAVTAHRSNEELSNEFSLNMVKAIRKYSEMNGGSLPARIIIYRDGVGDGQIPHVLNHEVNHLNEALAKLYGRPEAVKMTFVIVTKRINTRLFYNRRDNPPPGTVVDDVITNPWRYDFFIVSQCVRQGSVSPTAYNVIQDNAGLDVSALQRLTFQLTHMYFNWSGTVRVPAPCQYAHKLAFLVSQSIHRSPSAHLESLLYFL